MTKEYTTEGLNLWRAQHRTNMLRAQTWMLTSEIRFHDTLGQLNMTDDELRRVVKRDMCRALAEQIADKIPMAERQEGGDFCLTMEMFAIPKNLFWEIVRVEARQILNRAAGYPL
jgi:hypothetical protein